MKISQKLSGNEFLLICGMIFGVILVLFFINLSLMRKLEQAEKQIAQAQAPSPVTRAFQKKFSLSRKDELLRKSWLDPSREYEYNILYLNGKEVARFKSTAQKIFDLSGIIPDGQGQFRNMRTGTFGEEHYRNNEWHGEYKEYYKTGQVRKESLYIFGKLKSTKEYFIDGTLRMEINYEDALFFAEDPEAGEGKVFNRDGTLRYEWKITNMDQSRYKKAYNLEGKLIEEKYYDIKGQLVRTIRHE